MSAVLKHWPIIVTVLAATMFYGGLVSRVDSLESKVTNIEQIRLDLAVVKSRVEWLVDRDRQRYGPRR